MMKRTIAPLALVATACISSPALAGWNGLDWAILLNGLVRPAPVVVVQPVPVVVQPIPVVVPPATTYIPDSNAGLSSVNSETTASAATECEEKPYIQYKDELHVFGDKATIAQMCRIKLGTTPACGRELSKITLALHAADINTDDCSFLLGVAAGMTPDQVKASKVGSLPHSASLYDSPETSGRFLKELPAGTSVLVDGEQDAWIRVRAEDGSQGWIVKP
jgi:hypothetical protein